MNHPYVNAPKLPEGERVDLRSLVRGDEFELEVGPGRGGFIHERAMALPQRAILGLEIRRKWSQLLDEKCAKLGLAARVRVFAEDAKAAMPRAAACVAMCHPSASSAIEPKAMPAVISTTIITNVSAITHRVRRSPGW